MIYIQLCNISIEMKHTNSNIKNWAITVVHLYRDKFFFMLNVYFNLHLLYVVVLR